MQTERIKVLLIEDNPGDVRLMREMLAEARGVPFRLEHADRLSTGLARLAEDNVDVLLLDLGLPDSTGLSTFAQAHAQAPHVPIIVLTGLNDGDVAVQAVREGAQDYLVKGQVEGNVLTRAIRYAIERKRAEEQLKRRNQDLTVLNTIATMVSQTLSLEEILAVALDATLDATRFETGGIALWNEKEQCLQQVVSQGVEPELAAAFLGLPRAGGHRERLLHTGQPVFHDDTAHDPTVNPEIARVGLTISGMVPLAHKGKVLGVLAVATRLPRQWTEEDKSLLMAVSRQIATATANAQLYEETQRLAVFNENIVNSMAEGILMEDADGIITFVNPMMAELLGYALEELLGQHWTTIVPVEQRATVAQELTKRRQRIGGRYETALLGKDGHEVPVIVSARPLFDNGHFRGVLSVFTDITHRKQHERELEAIATVSAALRTASTRAEMLPIILDQLLDLLKAEGAALAMRDPISGETAVELGRGEWADWTDTRLPPDAGLSGQVMATGQPYLNNDVRSDPRIARPDLIGDLRSVACAPLIVQEDTIGVLWVGRKTDIAEEEVRLLTAIADMAANAIHRAALHEQTQQRLQRLTALRHIDMAITASLDLRVIFNVLLEQITAQLGVDAADVLLLNQHIQTLEYATGCGFRTEAIKHTRLHLGEGHAGRTALERRTIAISDFEAEQSKIENRKSQIQEEGFVAYCAVPLIAKGQVKGVLEIFHRAPLPFLPPAGGGREGGEWLDFLQTLAGQAAIAIDNAELFNNLQRSNVELALAYDATLEGWSRALELRDFETEGHTRRVTEMTLRLARTMGMSEGELVHVRRGALLHDIGKIAISDAILLKPDLLTDQEWELMRQHPVHAYEMLSPIAYLRPALDIPYCHHEKWDGTGYPQGLRSEQIPLAARIFAVVDVWDALRSDRPYRPAWSEEKAIQYVREQVGKHFDPLVVEMFLRIIGNESTENE